MNLKKRILGAVSLMAVVVVLLSAITSADDAVYPGEGYTMYPENAMHGNVDDNITSLNVSEVEAIISNEEQRIQEITEKIASLQSEGIDVTELQERIDELKENIEEAKEKLMEAKEEFKAGNDEKGQELLYEANLAINRCREIVSEVMILISRVESGMDNDGMDADMGTGMTDDGIGAGMGTGMMAKGAKERAKEMREQAKEMREQAKEMREQVKERVKEVHKKMVERSKAIKNTKERYEFMKERFENTRKELMKSKKAGGAGFDLSKRYMVFGVGMIEKWLEVIKEYVGQMPPEEQERVLEKVNSILAKIGEMKEKINSSSSPEELRSIAKEINEEWRDLRDEMRMVAFSVAISEHENIVERAKQLEIRLEERIAELKSEGIDTSKLEAILSNYIAKIEQAEAKLEGAKELVELGDSEGAREAIKECNRLIKDSFKDIKMISIELKKLMRLKQGQIFFGNQTGELFVSGNGSIEFVGSGIIVVRGNGTIFVQPDGALVTSVGFGNQSVEGGTAIVSGEGKAVIRGEKIYVRIEGSDIKLFVKGSGSALLNGEGYYRVKMLPSERMSEKIEYSDENGGETVVLGEQS